MAGCDRVLGVRKGGGDRVLGVVHPAHLARVRLAAVVCLEVVVHVNEEGGFLVALAVIEVAFHLAEFCNLQGNS